MEKCPFCGKAFKRLKTHLPHCKMTKNTHEKSHSEKTEVSNVLQPSEISSKPPKSKIAIKAHSGNAVLRLEKEGLKPETNVGDVIDESNQSLEQTRLSNRTSESQSTLNAGGLTGNVEQISSKISQRSNPGTTKRAMREATEKKPKGNDDFLKQETKDTVVRSKSKTRTKVKATTQKLPNDIGSEEKDGINERSNEGRNTDQQISKDARVSEATPVLNLERVQIRPEFEKEASVLELQSHPKILKSNYLRAKALDSVTAKHLEGRQSVIMGRPRNQLAGNIANTLIYQQSSVTVNKTNVWDHIKENLCGRKLINHADQEFVLKAKANAKESDCNIEASETSYKTSTWVASTGTNIRRVNASAPQVNFKREGRPRACYVAEVRKIEPVDLDKRSLAPPEHLLLQPTERYLNKGSLLPMENESAHERMPNSHAGVPKNPGIGMEWFPELYPGYRSIGLSMLPVKTREWDSPLRPFACKNEKSKVSLSERHLMHVRLNELPSWLNARDHSAKGLTMAVQRGYNRYYNKYINVKRGSFGGVTMLLVGYATLSYIWSYDRIMCNDFLSNVRWSGISLNDVAPIDERVLFITVCRTSSEEEVSLKTLDYRASLFHSTFLSRRTIALLLH